MTSKEERIEKLEALLEIYKERSAEMAEAQEIISALTPLLTATSAEHGSEEAD